MTINTLLFAIFPYMAIAIAIIVTCLRYFNYRFTYSSLSSQFLESKQLFWGSVSWHYGILAILTAHLIGFLMPRSRRESGPFMTSRGGRSAPILPLRPSCWHVLGPPATAALGAWWQPRTRPSSKPWSNH